MASPGVSDHFDLPIEKSSSFGKEQEDGWISGRLSLSILTIFCPCENWSIYNFIKTTTLLLCGFTTSENGCYVRFPVYLISCWFWEMTIIRASWDTQGASVAVVLVFTFLPFLYCVLHQVKPTITIEIPLVQWFTGLDLQPVVVIRPTLRVSKAKFLPLGLKSWYGNLQIHWKDQNQKDGNHWTKGSPDFCLQSHLVFALKSTESCFKNPLSVDIWRILDTLKNAMERRSVSLTSSWLSALWPPALLLNLCTADLTQRGQACSGIPV